MQVLTLFLFLAGFPLLGSERVPVLASGPETTVVLASPDDPYYPLAQEISAREGVPIAPTFDEALAQDPVFLLWVVCPSGLSDEVLVEFGLAVRDRPAAVSVGIITGITLEDARDLWLRALQVKGERIFAANAANPAGHIKAQILAFDGERAESQPLTRENLVQILQVADYITFTGHGGVSYLRLDEDTTLRAEHLPSMSPLVVATGSCNTFRPWESNSIALAFVHQGAAAYAGYAYSPNAGYLVGAYEGVPFRYTWPEFPIGHALQVQSRGSLQGFAQFPYLYLLGDPRIALQAQAPYRLAEDQENGKERTLTYVDAPAGMIPVRIPGGAAYRFVEIPGVGATWSGDPFYNANLQMVNIADDKFLLFAHEGGDFALNLRLRPPWVRAAALLVINALDGGLLNLQEGGGDVVVLILGIVALLSVVVLLWRKKASPRALLPAALTGLGVAMLYGLYALVRLDHVTIISKTVVFHPLGLVGTFLLAGCGAFLFLSACSWRGRVVAIVVASLGALLPAALLLSIMVLLNAFFLGPRVGAGLWNYASGQQLLITAIFECLLFGLIFALLRKKFGKREAMHT
jgi:hypothetical protein